MSGINKRTTTFKRKAVQYYIDHDITRKEAAQFIGCSDASITIWAQELNIARYFEMSALRGDNLKPIKLSNTQKQIIMGTILGDGCIHCREGSERRRTLSVGHGIKQKAYLQWKYDELHCTNKIAPYTTGYNSQGHRFTFTHPFIEQIWKQNYKDDTKAVSKQLIQDLDDLGLAVWYQDDGSWSKQHPYTRKDGTKVYYSRQVKFSTYCFDTQSLVNINNGLKYHGFDARTLNTAKGPVTVLSYKSSIDFVNRVAPYLTLKYKAMLGARLNGNPYVTKEIGSSL